MNPPLPEPAERILVTGGSGFLGTNLVEHFLRAGMAVLSTDSAAPRNPDHAPHWRPLDLRDAEGLGRLVAEFSPHHILHFGARTDLEGTSLEDYSANTAGVAHLIEAAAASPSLKRVLFASSMLVCRLGYAPKHDQDYCPDTLYGASKVEGERLVRDLVRDRFSWAIVRPTSIWGPWFGIPYRNFFEAVRRGWYLHPRHTEVRRSYGFALNSVVQVARMLAAPAPRLQGKVLYLADYEPLELGAWADEISRAFTRPRSRRVPLPLLRAAARLGDLLKVAGLKQPPLTSTRLRNLTTQALFDLEEVREICGPLPYGMAEGVQITARWLLQQANQP